MTISRFKLHLNTLETLSFVLPNQTLVPAHFHVTEIGKVAKTFIDCGGKLRQEKKINFQLWNANDYYHRLHPEKLTSIITIAEDTFGLEDLEIEVEFQGEQTIEKFGVDFSDGRFLLTSKLTDCLALDACGIPPKKKMSLSDIPVQNSCNPNSGCC